MLTSQKVKLTGVIMKRIDPLRVYRTRSVPKREERFSKMPICWYCYAGEEHPEDQNADVKAYADAVADDNDVRTPFRYDH